MRAPVLSLRRASAFFLPLFPERGGFDLAEDFDFSAEPVFKVVAVFTAAFFPELVGAKADVFFGEFERTLVETGVRESGGHDDLQGEDYCAPSEAFRNGRFFGSVRNGASLWSGLKKPLHGVCGHEEQDGVGLGGVLQEGEVALVLIGRERLVMFESVEGVKANVGDLRETAGDGGEVFREE